MSPASYLTAPPRVAGLSIAARPLLRRSPGRLRRLRRTARRQGCQWGSPTSTSSVGGAFEERSDCCSLPFVAMEVARDDHELAPVEWDRCIDRPLVEMQSGGIGARLRSASRPASLPGVRRPCSGSGSSSTMIGGRVRFPSPKHRTAAPRGVETDTARDSPARLARAPIRPSPGLVGLRP